MTRRTKYLLCLLATAALALPAGLYSYHQIKSRKYIRAHQARVDDRSRHLRALQNDLQLLCKEIAMNIPANIEPHAFLKDPGCKDILSSMDCPKPVFVLTLHDNRGRLLMRAAPLEATDEMRPELTWVFPDAEAQPPRELSRAVGNAARGLSGYSLEPYAMQSYGDLPSAAFERRKCLGAWLWDERLACGIILEIPAQFPH